MIDINKKYRLRNGWEARIYATDGCNGDIHGAYRHPDHGWIICSWRSDGSWLRTERVHDFDLVKARPRIKRTVWLNVYPGGVLAYGTREGADYQANRDRIACYCCEFDIEEGHGL